MCANPAAFGVKDVARQLAKMKEMKQMGKTWRSSERLVKVERTRYNRHE